MTDEQLAEIEAEREYVVEASRWDSFLCRTLLETHVPALLAEVRRRGQVITQMQQAIDAMGDAYEPAVTHDPVGADADAPRLRPGEER